MLKMKHLKIMLLTLLLSVGFIVNGQIDHRNLLVRQIANGDTILSRIYNGYDTYDGSNPIFVNYYDSTAFVGSRGMGVTKFQSYGNATINGNSYLGNATNDTAFFSGYVGINNTVPSDWLHIRTGQTADKGISIRGFSATTTDYPVMSFYRSHNNTAGVLTRTVSSEIIGGLDCYAINSSAAIVYTGGLNFQQTIANAAYSPTDMIFYASRATTQPPNARVRFSSGGQILLIGSAASSATLQSSSNFSISFNQQTAQSIGIEKNTSGNGSNLNITAGGGQTNGADRNGGMITIGAYADGGMSTGTGFRSVRITRDTRAATSGTADNTPIDNIVVLSENNLVDNVAKGVFEVSLPTDAGAALTYDFSIIATDGDTTQTYKGIAQLIFANGNNVTAENVSVDVGKTVDIPVGTTDMAVTITTTHVAGTKVTIKVTADVGFTATAIKLYGTITNQSAQSITQL